MFWITFLISGLTIASIPWVSSHFSNKIAGFIVLVPVMLTLSLVVQYLADGQKATLEMVKATLWGLPTLIIFSATTYVLLKNHVNLPLTIVISLLVWLVSVAILSSVIGK